MQNPYKPPDTELNTEEPKVASVVLFLLAANTGFLVISALVLSLLYYSGGSGNSGLNYFNVVGTLMVSAGCSFVSSILLLPFRKIRLRWAAIAGSLLSIFFCFALAVLDEL